MFPIDVSTVSYIDPWTRDYGTRLDELKKGQCKIAYYYRKPDSSTFRYRVYNMIETLRMSNSGISASYFHEEELDRINEVLSVADILIVCRAQYCDRIDHLITVAKNKGKEVIYDIDDMIFDTKYVQLILNTIDADISSPDVWNYWFGEISRYAAVLSMCDRITTTSNYLAEKIRQFSRKQVSVIPNFLNEEQLKISRAIYNSKKRLGFHGPDPVCLGYFSGTRTHNKDFYILTDALINLFEKYRNLNLRIVGFVDLDDRMSKYSNRVEVLQFTDFINLQRYIGQIEINLIPLQDNVFTNSKSELKFFEAGIVGTISVATPTHAYANAIENGINGYLAKSYEWFEVLDSVLGNIEDYGVVAENAYNTSEQDYSWRNMGRLIENTLFNQEN